MTRDPRNPQRHAKSRSPQSPLRHERLKGPAPATTDDEKRERRLDREARSTLRSGTSRAKQAIDDLDDRGRADRP